MMSPRKIILALALLIVSLLACAQFIYLDPASPPLIQDTPAVLAKAAAIITPTPFLPVQHTSTALPIDPDPEPTPTQEIDENSYIVQAGDTLNQIASRFGVSLYALSQANELANPNHLEAGQVIAIPTPGPPVAAAEEQLIPDSELVYGLSTIGFDIAEFIRIQDGYLAQHSELVDGLETSGAQVIERIAREYSVNPRLLLAILEYQSGWVTRSEPDDATRTYPLRVMDPWRTGLYRQLAWTANTLNEGYYRWRVGALPSFHLADGGDVPANPGINAGTAGLLHFFARLYDRPGWEQATSPQGALAIYQAWFGPPFALAVDPLIPADLTQPDMQLPFEPGDVWSFTGGPHGGFADGSAWAAIDFAPPGDPLGCWPSYAWVVAVADGLVVRSEAGAVVQDLDGDGYEQTGWSVLYLHIATQNRVPNGTYLQAGERIGHPSCEGGVSTGTHLHLARRYNGEWIPSDQSIPFVMDGWVSSGYGVVYNGFLQRDGQTVTALNGRYPANAISR
jgi:LasA protease